jgi:hypothetical protein
MLDRLAGPIIMSLPEHRAENWVLVFAQMTVRRYESIVTKAGHHGDSDRAGQGRSMTRMNPVAPARLTA